MPRSQYAKVVDLYLRDNRAGFRGRLSFFEGQPDLASAIRVAALSLDERGLRQSHQRRIKPERLTEAHQRLLANEATLSGSSSFSALFAHVNRIARPINGIGELAVYDFAHRIGAFLGLYPEVVYLHAGARDGARALGLSGRAVSRMDLSEEWHRLRCDEIEDCFCHYKKLIISIGIGLPVDLGEIGRPRPNC